MPFVKCEDIWGIKNLGDQIPAVALEENPRSKPVTSSQLCYWKLNLLFRLSEKHDDEMWKVWWSDQRKWRYLNIVIEEVNILGFYMDYI